MAVFSVIICILIFRENHEGDGGGDGNAKVALSSAEVSFVLLGRVGSAEDGEMEKKCGERPSSHAHLLFPYPPLAFPRSLC